LRISCNCSLQIYDNSAGYQQESSKFFMVIGASVLFHDSVQH
jgi:hypothetical protein